MIRYANVGLTWCASLGLALIFIKLGAHGTFGQDSHAYWLALQGGDVYGKPAELDAYLYSPLFVQALTPLGWLSWPVFRMVWLAAGVAGTVWLVRPLPVRWAVPVAMFAVSDLVIGNVYVFLGVMVALGAARTSYAWLFGVLTKVTPGIGLLWLLARGEYQAVARAAVVLGLLAGTSMAVSPDAWDGWIQLLTSGDGGDPTLIPRCVLAVALVIWGARRHPAWLAVAVVAAIPVFNAAACFVPLLAIPRLLAQRYPPNVRLDDCTDLDGGQVRGAPPAIPSSRG